jgi:hypothetical protein
MTGKICLACDRPIKGRIDKKFCDDSCRNNYNNRLNSDSTPVIRTINNILRRNRRILSEILRGSDKPEVVEKERLIAEGFHFEFFTELFTNDKEEVYYYCYDYGYRALEGEKYMAVKNKKRDYTGRKRKLPLR